jgi:hypothetical protein
MLAGLFCIDTGDFTHARVTMHDDGLEIEYGLMVDPHGWADSGFEAHRTEYLPLASYPELNDLASPTGDFNIVELGLFFGWQDCIQRESNEPNLVTEDLLL